MIRWRLSFVLFVFSPILSAAASLYDSELYSQIELELLTDSTRERFLSDVRMANVGTVLLSFLDFFEEGENRRPMLDKLAREMRFFETNGVSTLVWINGLGYGNERTGVAAKRLANSTRLTAFDGQTTGAICPTDSVIRQALRENVRDIAKAGARFILMDDEFVQSVRPGLGCVCSNHLALVSEAVGRPVTALDIRDSFTGKPNAVRTAFLDVSGRLLTDLARELRREVDAVDPTIGMGICASYTHYDVEGTEMDALIAAFAGKARPLFRISGAPYWRDSRYHGSGLEGTLEFVRMQSAWYRDAGFPVLDENDPWPRKTSVTPAYLCEMYDKAVIADGGLRRNKYMLCYGPDRSETGYLEAHLENQADDVAIGRIFARTRSFGVRVLFPRQSIRQAELPTPYAGDWTLEGLFSHPLAGHFLVRNGIPTRYAGEGPAIAFGTAAFAVGAGEISRGVVVDREAARILRQRGVDTSTDRFEVLNFNGADLNASEAGRYRERLLSAFRRFAGCPLSVSVETAAPNVYQIVSTDGTDKSYSVLLENLGERPADVKIRTAGRPSVVESLRGVFAERADGLELKAFPPHAYAAVKFCLSAERKGGR